MNKTELLNEAKKAKSLEELTQMAADVGIPLTEEEAKFYFSLVNQKQGDELSLEELDAATGGFFDKLSRCIKWRCYKCGGRPQDGPNGCKCAHFGVSTSCNHCRNDVAGSGEHCSMFVSDGTSGACG